MTTPHARRLAAFLLATMIAVSCGSSADTETGSADTEPSGAESADAPGVRVVSVDEGAAIVNDPPDDLVVLDVRTPDEFAEAHIEGAVLIDFYEADFADQIAALDRDVPYVLYCRSGNRSSGAREMMNDLGFADVADIDGGILSWSAANLPVVSG